MVQDYDAMGFLCVLWAYQTNKPLIPVCVREPQIVRVSYNILLLYVFNSTLVVCLSFSRKTLSPGTRRVIAREKKKCFFFLLIVCVFFFVFLPFRFHRFLRYFFFLEKTKIHFRWLYSSVFGTHIAERECAVWRLRRRRDDSARYLSSLQYEKAFIYAPFCIISCK